MPPQQHTRESVNELNPTSYRIRPAFAQWIAHQNARPAPWLGLFALILAVQISPRWYPTPDAATYLSLARNILIHHRFAVMGESHLAYPPGYPLLVSPVFLFSPRPFLFLSIGHWVMAVVFMIGVLVWSRRVAPGAALLITGLAVMTAPFWIYYRRTLSETAFMAAMIWAVNFLDQAIDDKEGSRQLMNLMAGMLLLCLLASIRESGVLFGAGFAIAAVLASVKGTLRRTQAAMMAALVMIPAIVGVGAFILYDQYTRSASGFLGTHLNGFTDRANPLIQRIVEGLRLEIAEAGRLTMPGMFKSYAPPGRWLNINTAIFVFIFVLIAIGWWRLMRRHSETMSSTLPLYFGIYVFWSFDADTRYLLPIFPVILVSLWYALDGLGAELRQVLLAAALVLHLSVAAGYWIFVEIPRGRECDRQWKPVGIIAAALQDEPGKIATGRPVPDCARLMLSFLLDRPVAAWKPDLPGAADTSLLIISHGSPAPSGFLRRETSGPYEILMRSGTGAYSSPRSRSVAR